jgi:hypothetical protein
MLVRLCKRRGEYPSGSIVDLPQAEAESLIGFGLAERVADVDAEAPTRLVERAKVSKGMRTATLSTTPASVAESTEVEA